MKKSKIIGLSLGFSALAAVAISTPFIVTSCSSANEKDANAIEAKISANFATFKFGTSDSGASSATATNMDGNNFVADNNVVTIYTGTTDVDSKPTANTFVNLSLSTTLNQIISKDDITKAGLTESAKVVWALDTKEGWTLDEKTNVLTNNKAINGSETITIKATITDEKQPVVDAKEGSDANGSQDENKDPSNSETNKEQITKTLSIKITFTAGAKPSK